MIIIYEWVLVGVNVSLFIFDPYLLEGFWGIFVHFSMHEVKLGLMLEGFTGENFKIVVKRLIVYFWNL